MGQSALRIRRAIWRRHLRSAAGDSLGKTRKKSGHALSVGFALQRFLVRSGPPTTAEGMGNAHACAAFHAGLRLHAGCIGGVGAGRTLTGHGAGRQRDHQRHALAAGKVERSGAGPCKGRVRRAELARQRGLPRGSGAFIGARDAALGAQRRQRRLARMV